MGVRFGQPGNKEKKNLYAGLLGLEFFFLSICFGAAKKEEEEEIHDESVLDSVIKFVADSVKQFLAATAWTKGLFLHVSWVY